MFYEYNPDFFFTILAKSKVRNLLRDKFEVRLYSFSVRDSFDLLHIKMYVFRIK